MQKAISIFLACFTAMGCCVKGIYTKAAAKVNPEKYHVITIDTAGVPEPAAEKQADAYVQLSENNMHYEVYGTGATPVVLIHGNGSGAGALRGTAQLLAQNGDYTCYCIDSRCHGLSTDCDKITYELMAMDICEFIKALGLNQPIIIGHSDGAIVGLTLASEYPEVPGAVLAYGANSSPEAAWFQFRFWVHWENLLQKDKLNDLMLSGPHFTEAYLARITCPCYVVGAFEDLMPISDTMYIGEHIKNCDWAIIKDATHSSYVTDECKQCYALSKAWLDTKGI